MPYTVARPSPVPFPGPFVVKKRIVDLLLGFPVHPDAGVADAENRMGADDFAAMKPEKRR